MTAPAPRLVRSASWWHALTALAVLVGLVWQLVLVIQGVNVLVAAVTNALLHYVSPLMAVIGWLLFGPRPRIDENTLLLSLIWPALYVSYTFAHGAASDWYLTRSSTSRSSAT